jgi:hypothetical protein
MGNIATKMNYSSLSPQSLGAGDIDYKKIQSHLEQVLNIYAESQEQHKQRYSKCQSDLAEARLQASDFVLKFGKEQNAHKQTQNDLLQLDQRLQAAYTEYNKLKAEKERLAMKFGEEQRGHSQTKNALQQQTDENRRLEQKWRSVLTERNDLSTKIGLLQHENETLKKEKRELEDKLKKASAATPVATDRGIHISGTDGVISDFNLWAANPSARLPSNFHYITGDLQIRTEQALPQSAAETQWIVNNTAKKYLFPNPHLFDELTDISRLYRTNSGNLKPQGQNKIRIVKACEISDKGWVDYPGELELL